MISSKDTSFEIIITHPLRLTKKYIKGIHKVRVGNALLPQILEGHNHGRKERDIVLEVREGIGQVAIVECLVNEGIDVVAEGFVVVEHAIHTIGVTFILLLDGHLVSLFVQLNGHGKIVRVGLTLKYKEDLACVAAHGI